MCLALPAALTAGAEPPAKPAAGPWRVYVGTYTRGASEGVYLYQLDAAGRLRRLGLAARLDNPSFLAAHPNGRWLYAVNEVSRWREQRTGAVAALAADPATGRLKLLGQQPSGGSGPCHVAVDPNGRCVLVANYGGGSVAALSVLPDGRLEPPASVRQHAGSSVHPRRQQGPHAHCVNVDPTGRFVLAADLGLDKIFVYRLDAAAVRLTPHEFPFLATAPGAGPRHLAFHPNGRFVYAINELDSTISALGWDAAAGRLTLVQTVSTLPSGWAGENTAAEIAVHPSGRLVFGSNRGHDSIAVFAVDERTGRLAPRGHVAAGGATPRHVALAPGGTLLLAANRNSDSIAVFRVDVEAARLEPIGRPVPAPSPVCLLFAPVFRREAPQ